MQSIEVSYPLELVHLDFLSIESGKNQKDVNVLVIMDHFMRYTQVFITPLQTAGMAAKMLLEKFFVYYSFPKKILTDQGRNFESTHIAELC